MSAVTQPAATQRAVTHLKVMLANNAESLLALHNTSRPLVLPNVWDVTSAKAVEAAGFAAVATSSRAVAQAFGEPDDNSSDPDLIFDYLARIASAVRVPVSADLQGGLGLSPEELVGRMLDAGIVGCNIEDSSHGIDADPGKSGGATNGPDDLLLPISEQCDYIARFREAARATGVHLVMNARTDTFIRHVGAAGEQVDEAVRRGGAYLDAGADCVFPIAVSSKTDATAIVGSINGPVNLMSRHGGLSVAELTAIGASRISFGSGIYSYLSGQLTEVLDRLSAGGELN